MKKNLKEEEKQAAGIVYTRGTYLYYNGACMVPTYVLYNI